jgi:hypothetical protein
MHFAKELQSSCRNACHLDRSRFSGEGKISRATGSNRLAALDIRTIPWQYT